MTATLFGRRFFRTASLDILLIEDIATVRTELRYVVLILRLPSALVALIMQRHRARLAAVVAEIAGVHGTAYALPLILDRLR